MSRFICLLVLSFATAAILYVLLSDVLSDVLADEAGVGGTCGGDGCEGATNVRLVSKPLHLGVQRMVAVQPSAPLEDSPREKRPKWSEAESKRTYAALKRGSLKRFDADYAQFVYDAYADLTLARSEQAPVSTQVVADIALSPEVYRAAAEPLLAEAPVLLPSRGLRAPEDAPLSEEPQPPLITYDSSSWRAGALNRGTRKTSQKLRCSDKARRTWRGEGRISHQDYVEPFVVCEGGGSFSVSVGWRTSDVCVAGAGLKLPARISEVSVLGHASRGGAALGRARGKDRLSIRTEEGSRMLLSCDDAVWAIARVGKTAWRDRPG